jgi:hypothetical protein
VLDSNLGQDTGCPTTVFYDFPQSLQTCLNSTSIWLHLLPSKSGTIHQLLYHSKLHSLDTDVIKKNLKSNTVMFSPLFSVTTFIILDTIFLFSHGVPRTLTNFFKTWISGKLQQLSISLAKYCSSTYIPVILLFRQFAGTTLLFSPVVFLLHTVSFRR